MKINKEPECEIVKKQLRKTQEDWIKHFNKKGEKMISTPDIYNAAKKGNKAIIESLKKDFDDDYKVTSTRIDYSKNEVIHDADSKIIKPKPLRTFIIREPKTRKIRKSYFVDRIVHHAICNIVESNFQGNISSLQLDRLIKQARNGVRV